MLANRTPFDVLMARANDATLPLPARFAAWYEYELECWYDAVHSRGMRWADIPEYSMIDGDRLSCREMVYAMIVERSTKI